MIKPDSDDDERTVLGSPFTGVAALPVGHRLQEFIIEGIVGEGGFSIVYLARDTQLGRNVALKEYMPSMLASRGADHLVSARSQRHAEPFKLGLRSFVNEAQLLASFDHPALVKVYRFWEQNGTAYMVMPLYEGPTLKAWLAEHETAPDEAWLRALLGSLLDALELIHREHCYHRDIAPDNILLLPPPPGVADPSESRRPLLLDFGAARRVIGDATQALTVILKPGYAPIEQYAETADMKQGPWTDVYALCAVLYAAVTGHVPAPSVSRMLKDELVPALDLARGRYSEGFLAAIDAGLAVRPEQRPQTMAELHELFAASDPTAEPMDGDARYRAGPPSRSSTFEVDSALPTPAASTAGERPAPIAPPPRKWRPAVYGLGGLAATATIAALIWWFTGPVTAPPAVKPDARPELAGAPTAEPPSAQVSVPPSTAEAPIATSATSTPMPAAAVSSFSVLAALQDIVARADRALVVDANLNKTVLVINRDRLVFRVRSSESGYLYLFAGSTDMLHFYLLFPTQSDQRGNRIEAGREVTLPRPPIYFTAGGPPGTNHFAVVVSRRPRDFSQTGLQRAGNDIPEFDIDSAKQRWLARTGPSSPFIGDAICNATQPCDGSYGAHLLEVTEVSAPVK